MLSWDQESASKYPYLVRRTVFSGIAYHISDMVTQKMDSNNNNKNNSSSNPIHQQCVKSNMVNSSKDEV